MVEFRAPELPELAASPGSGEWVAFQPRWGRRNRGRSDWRRRHRVPWGRRIRRRDGPWRRGLLRVDPTGILKQNAAAPMSEPDSSIGREFVSGLIGAGVSVACILPPILHLVTGPLGPMIGGFVAANRVRPGPRAQIIVALTIATALSGFVGSALGVAASVAAPNELPDWFPTTTTRIVAVAAVIFVYAGTLAAIGTVIRAAAGQSKNATS